MYLMVVLKSLLQCCKDSCSLDHLGVYDDKSNMQAIKHIYDVQNWFTSTSIHVYKYWDINEKAYYSVSIKQTGERIL